MLHKRVLVLGHDERSTLTVVRSLGRAGIEVHLAWCTPQDIPATSRYVYRHHDIALPAVSAEWKSQLLELLRSTSFDAILPCSDREIIPLQLDYDFWMKQGNFMLLAPEHFALTYDKLNTMKMADKLAIPQSRWSFITSMEELEHFMRETNFPLVLKPCSSFSLEKASRDKRHVLRGFNAAEVNNYAAKMLQDGPIIVQENFIGIGVGIEVLAKEGVIPTAFQHRRLHEAPHGSGSSYRCSMSLNSAMYEAVESITKEMRYTGVMMVEFKWNPETNAWIFIEINARFWGSIPLSVASGINFPLYLYEMMVEGKTAFNKGYRVPYFCRNTWRDAGWFIKNLRADRKNQHLNTRPINEVLLEFLNIFRGRESNDTFAFDDMRPAWSELLYLKSRIEKKAVIRLYKICFRLPWMRKKHIQRAATLLGAAHKILFVCKGNICRSPFAEKYAASHIPGKLFSSAGYYPESGRISPEYALKAAALQGVYLDHHRSQVVTDHVLEQQDVAIVFDLENYVELRKKFPKQKNKIILLGMHKDVFEAVDDPYGKPLESFVSCYFSIESHINKIFLHFSTSGK